MAKVKPIQKAEYEGEECDPMYLEDKNTPEKVMFNAQGAIRLDRPLKSDGTSDSQ